MPLKPQILGGSMPNNRPGLGDDTERYIRHEHGYIEWRYAPGNTVEIVNIEVDADYRGKGIGRQLVQRLCKLVTANYKIYAITRSNNEIAQNFYEALKFNVVGVLRRFYDNERQVDAIMYGRSAGGPI